MPNQWYVLVMGEQIGPLSDDGLREMAAKRQLTPDDVLRKGHAGDWVPASRVRGLFQQPAVAAITPGNAISPTPPSLTPVAVTVADATEKDSAAAFIEQTKSSPSHLVACLDCGKRISPNASSCPNCGHAFFRPSRSLAILLAGFLGGIGIHKFYLRKPADGFIALLFCWTFIPAIFALIESFQYLSMDDETFVRKFGTVPNTNAVGKPQMMQGGSTLKLPSKRPWIGWAVAAFLILAMIGAISSSPDHSGTVTAKNDRQSANTSYTRPTLHDKTALDWQTGSYDDKLATCTFFLWGLWQKDELRPHIQNSIHSIEDLQPYARELVVCIDAATRPEPNPAENRRIFSQFKVHQIAAAGIVRMGWGD